MKKPETVLQKVDSLTHFHRMFGLPKPKHPLVSFIDIEQMNYEPAVLPGSLVLNFYKIAYKATLCGKARYGQNYYDFSEGGLVFTAPGQVFESPSGEPTTGYMVLIHPDFLLSYAIAKKIKQYGFFSYSANEALHVSDEEKATIMLVFRIIDDELTNRIDDFSQDVIISQLELLLTYSNRFYKRQFLTRKAVNNDLLQKLDDLLDDYYANQTSLKQGIPTVQYLADRLHLSPSYLSDMLRVSTGQNAQHLIHHKLVEKAKELLSTSQLSVSEVAYQLGFEHPQSFSRLFKLKTALSPVAFKQSFN
ncbi:helix-turn-helix transcriptional regulator [Spirosoma sp. RP8]|uniref:Helix-turn-helix transcriptional regulator n=1 Tax=Spirosoma liriopis TaxID=2937440 RepID=A0ABT0HUB7_9BACT|nr:AraC family transcriptional regulator [Spirosoma liriopis]MCK8495779.1 helix-turn-helix transcriptional regulator [Spirosoma liriopis]